MVATSGDPLLETDAVDTLREVLMPRVRIITPNIPEAELLLGKRISSQDELPALACELSHRCGGVSVLLKAGHLHDDKLVDAFYNAEAERRSDSNLTGWPQSIPTVRAARCRRP